MDPKLLEKKAAVQRSHAVFRARERYGLYIDNCLYDEIRERCWSAIRAPTPTTRILGVEGQEAYCYVMKVLFLGEWVLLVFDAQTRQIRTFLPPRSRYIKGMSVETA